MKAFTIRRGSSLELLETRIAPAVVFGVTHENDLIRFDSATPGTIESTRGITGLADGEVVLGIDFRPATFQLYAIGSTGVVYELDLATAKATAVSGTVLTLQGSELGFDFNPMADRIRLVSNADQNFRINPNTGALSFTDTTLAYAGADVNAGANPNVVASAYTNNFAGATTTTLYGLDTVLNILVTQNPPNNGALNTVGSLGVDPTGPAAFDIQTRSGTNTAFAALSTDGTSSSLYTINLTTGAAALVGAIGTGDRLLRGMSVAPEGFVAKLTGAIAQFTGGPLDDTLLIDAEGGLLRHNRFSAGDPGFASDFDFDPLTGGDQTLSDDPGAAGLLVNGGVGKDQIENTNPGTVMIVDITLPGDTIVGAKGLLTKKSLTFPDADGDAVKFTISKGALSFSNFQFTAGALGVAGLQLETLLISDVQFTGANAAFAAKRTADGGNNSVAVGYIQASGIDLGAVKVAGDLGRIAVGNPGNPAPAVKSLTVQSIGAYGATTQGAGASLLTLFEGSVGALVVRGNVYNGIIEVSDPSSVLGKVQIGGSLIGLSGPSAGSIFSFGRVGSVTIGGSLIGSGDVSGRIEVLGDIGPVKIRHSVIGLSGAGAASIRSSAGNIASVTIGGDLIVEDAFSGIFAGKQIGTVTLGGSANVIGSGTALIAAVGNASSPGLTPAQSVAIKSVNVKGSATSLNILAGYNLVTPSNPDVQIGSVTIGGDWSRGSIVAGVIDGGNDFGNSLDALIAGGDPALPSRIASIVIKGQAIGTPLSPGDFFGFVAEQVVSVRIGGATLPLTPGPNNDLAGIPIGINIDFRVREV